jgi:hypothetical protein
MKPPDRLRQATGDLERVTAQWPGFTIALQDRTPDGYPTGGDKGPTIGISNPTPSVVIARIRWVDIWAEAEALAIQVQADSRRLYQLVTSIGDQAHDTTQRCTGAPDKPWGRADCTNNAVRNGLCWACIKRGQRWQDVHMSTSA